MVSFEVLNNDERELVEPVDVTQEEEVERFHTDRSTRYQIHEHASIHSEWRSRRSIGYWSRSDPLSLSEAGAPHCIISLSRCPTFRIPLCIPFSILCSKTMQI
jgi:hypothetical protein